MATVKVLALQNFFDLSLQYTGIVDNAFKIAQANGKSVSAVLNGGDLIVIDDLLPKDTRVLQYYAARNIIPATGLKAKKNNYEFVFGFPIQF